MKEEEVEVGLVVKTPVGWGVIRHKAEGGKVVIHLDWAADAYVRVEDIVER